VEARRIPAPLIILLVVAACHRVPDRDQLEREAGEAMQAFGQATIDEGERFSAALAVLKTKLGVAPSEAPLVVNEVLESLDRVLLRGERALAATDAYVKNGGVLDDDTLKSLESLRRMTKDMHRVRELVAKGRKPLSREEAQQVLQGLSGASLTPMDK
jgi:hypothetical protein